MKIADFAMPGLIVIAAGVAIWYIARQNTAGPDAPSTAGNDTASHGVSSPGTPSARTDSSRTPPGSSSQYSLPANLGIIDPSAGW